MLALGEGSTKPPPAAFRYCGIIGNPRGISYGLCVHFYFSKSLTLLADLQHFIMMYNIHFSLV